MNINRHNYEEWFMRFADNELSEAEQQAVQAFAAANPDLQAELQFFLQCKLDPSEEIVFAHKSDLLQPAPLHANNCSEWLVASADGELTEEEQALLNAFLSRYPAFSGELESIRRLKLEPDTRIVYPDKQELYRHEKERRVVPIRWWTIAAAAMVILVAGFFWLTRENDERSVQGLASQTGTAPGNTNNAVGQTGQEKSQTPAPAPIAKETKEEHDPHPTAGANGHLQPKLGHPGENSQTQNLQQVATSTTPASTSEKPELPSDPAIKAVSIGSPEQKTSLIAAVQAPVVDQPDARLVPEEKTSNVVYYANTTMDESQNVDVLNTAVSTKNSMRGLLRKASRIISKRNNTDSKGRGLLIGGFEIAVR